VYLVDTSVWVDFFNARSVPHVERLKRLLIADSVLGFASSAPTYNRFELILNS